MIAIDASRLAVAARTGTEQYTFELLAAIARRDRYTPFRLYVNQLPAALPPLGPNFSLRRIPLPRFWTHARLSAEVVLHPPDVLFVPAHVLPLGLPLARGTRSVVTIHDLGYLHFPAAHTRAQRLYLRLSTAWSARVASRVIAISQATRDDLVRMAGVPAAKIRVIYHGVSQPYVVKQLSGFSFQTPNPSFESASPQPSTLNPQSYFLFIGTVQPRKNLARVIEAFARLGGPLPLAGPLPELVIVGKRGWLSDTIERRAGELGVAGRVRFTGYLPAGEVQALLRGALAFVFPSLYEGFGMPVLEAMAAGVPVLTSDSSSLPEVAGDAALLVDPTDTQAIAAALARLASDGGLRADLRARGLARAAHFTWDACAEQTLAALNS